METSTEKLEISCAVSSDALSPVQLHRGSNREKVICGAHITLFVKNLSLKTLDLGFCWGRGHFAIFMPFEFSIPKTELRSCAFVLRKALHLRRAKSFGKAIAVYLKHDALMGIVCATLFKLRVFPLLASHSSLCRLSAALPLGFCPNYFLKVHLASPVLTLSEA